MTTSAPAMSSNSSDDDLPIVPLNSMSSSSSDDDQPMRSLKSEFLSCPLLETQAKVGEEGDSESCTSNSRDDGSQSDMSYVSPTNQHADADRHVYLQSLGSQAEQYGFEAPINLTRRDERWISSFEPSVRYKAEDDYLGNVCPEGHKLFARKYKQSRWCDMCTNEMIPGTCGESCRACDFYDICSSCAETGSRQSHPPDAFQGLWTDPAPVPFWAPPASWHSAHLQDACFVHAPQSEAARVRPLHRMKLVRKQNVASTVDVSSESGVTVAPHLIDQ
jgi:hypothetical protein